MRNGSHEVDVMDWAVSRGRAFAMSLKGHDAMRSRKTKIVHGNPNNNNNAHLTWTAGAQNIILEAKGAQGRKKRAKRTSRIILMFLSSSFGCSRSVCSRLVHLFCFLVMLLWTKNSPRNGKKEKKGLSRLLAQTEQSDVSLMFVVGLYICSLLRLPSILDPRTVNNRKNISQTAKTSAVLPSANTHSHTQGLSELEEKFWVFFVVVRPTKKKTKRSQRKFLLRLCYVSSSMELHYFSR